MCFHAGSAPRWKQSDTTSMCFYAGGVRLFLSIRFSTLNVGFTFVIFTVWTKKISEQHKLYSSLQVVCVFHQRFSDSLCVSGFLGNTQHTLIHSCFFCTKDLPIFFRSIIFVVVPPFWKLIVTFKTITGLRSVKWIVSPYPHRHCNFIEIRSL